MRTTVATDSEPIRNDGTRVQDATDQTVATDPVALRHFQDRLGLADTSLHVLRRHHGSLQRSVRHDGRPQRESVDRQRRHSRDALYHR